MIYGVIDMGSNTIRLNVYKYENLQLNLLFGKKDRSGLVSYVHKGSLSKEGINKACNVLNEFKNIVDHLNINHLFVFATASLRNISNKEEALSTIHKNTGLEIDIISGKDEALYDFIGATRILGVTDGVLIDIGGGSTEVVTFKNGKPLYTESMPIGCLNLYHSCVQDLLPNSEERNKIKEIVLKELEMLKIDKNTHYKVICGVGGTVRGIKKLNNAILDIPKANHIDVNNLNKIFEIITKDSKESLNMMLQVVPDRIHTITPGIIILNTLATYFESQIITVNTYGVREGYLLNILSRKE